MITPQLSEAQFDRISQHLTEQGTKLVVCDFNGVLDDNYGTKYDFIDSVLGSEHSEEHFARLALQTDTAYVQDRSATLERTIIDYCQSNGIEISDEGNKLLNEGPRSSVLTAEAGQFLGALVVPVVIFTAQGPERLYRSVDRDFLESLNIDVVTLVPKPSVDCLIDVLSRKKVLAGDACMIGDGLIDDILPAKLLGMQTVLVSPLADVHINE